MMLDRMYDFSDRHLEFLTEYFAVAGIKLCQDTELGIIYLEGTDGIGEKLPKLATIYRRIGLFCMGAFSESYSTWRKYWTVGQKGRLLGTASEPL